MIATWMGYAVVVGLIVAIGAAALDRAARAMRRQTRWVWLAALLVAAVLPMVAPLAQRWHPAPASGGVSMGTATGGATASVTRAGVLSPNFADFIAGLDRPLLLLWLSLTMLALARIAIATARLWRKRHEWSSAEIDGVPLYVTPDLGPAVVAMPDARILVPQWMLGLDAPALSTVIRHEREHRVAGDARLLLGASIVGALLPWNPAVWLLRRRLRLAVEMDCDARVLRHDPRIDRYGSLLLAIAQHPRRAPRLAAALTESTSDLERRINAMTTRPAPAPRARAATLAIVAAGAIGVACALPGPDVVAPRTNTAVAQPEKLSTDMPLFEFQVEKPASASPSNMPPTYPQQLRAAGIEGTVVAKFVVDTTGHVDMGTFGVVSSNHDGFTAAVREALPAMKFYPAQAGGRKVKQLIQMPFMFSLVKNSGPATKRPATVQPTPVTSAPIRASVTSPIATTGPEIANLLPVPLPTNLPPVYPQQLRAANIEGQVRVAFVVRPDGAVDMATVIFKKSDHDAFTAAVRAALEKMRFKPAAPNGVPVSALMELPFIFSLAR